MASYFQLVENKSKNNSIVRLDVTQATYNHLCFINDMILGWLFAKKYTLCAIITHIQATVCTVVNQAFFWWQVHEINAGNVCLRPCLVSVSIQGRWAGLRNKDLSKYNIFHLRLSASPSVVSCGLKKRKEKKNNAHHSSFRTWSQVKLVSPIYQ